jgi:hypothetical protein
VKQVEFPPVVAFFAVAIFLLAFWATGFSHSCRSDGCIGVIIPAGASAVTLALQLLVVIPVVAFKRHRNGLPLWRSLGVWAGVSIAAFAIPIAFAK